MKVTKKQLNKIIESYLLQEVPVDHDYIIDKPQFDRETKKPGSTTKNNKISNEEKNKWINTFFDAFDVRSFDQFTSNWKLFQKEYPKISTVWSLFDVTGVTGYADLAESIDTYYEKERNGQLTVVDDAIFFLNMINASPVGLLAGGFLTRWGVKGVNLTASTGKTIVKSASGKSVNSLSTALNAGLEVSLDATKTFWKNIWHASDNIAETITPTVIKKISSNVNKLFPKISAEFIEKNLSRVVKFFDSIIFRGICKWVGTLSENLGSDIFKWALFYIEQNPSILENVNKLLKFIKTIIKNIAPENVN